MVWEAVSGSEFCESIGTRTFFARVWRAGGGPKF